MKPKTSLQHAQATAEALVTRLTAPDNFWIPLPVMPTSPAPLPLRPALVLAKALTALLSSMDMALAVGAEVLLVGTLVGTMEGAEAAFGTWEVIRRAAAVLVTRASGMAMAPAWKHRMSLLVQVGECAA